MFMRVGALCAGSVSIGATPGLPRVAFNVVKPTPASGRPLSAAAYAAMNSFHLRTMYSFSSMTAFQQATAPMRST